MPDMTKYVLGIELGSTRIKAVLLDEHHVPASGKTGTSTVSGHTPPRPSRTACAPPTPTSSGMSGKSSA